MKPLQTAINAALNCDWKKAAQINQQIIKEQPTNIEALNRLGFAYLNLSIEKKAKSAFDKVLKLDPSNPIAVKNLKKLKSISKNSTSNRFSSQACLRRQVVSPKVFLEEPGITKIVNLINLTSKEVLSSLSCGQEVILLIKKNRIEIRSFDNQYLGILPDDLAFTIKRFILQGNKYVAFIKTVDDDLLTVIIRETYRGKKVNEVSFGKKGLANYHTSIRSELLEELTASGTDNSSDDTDGSEEE